MKQLTTFAGAALMAGAAFGAAPASAQVEDLDPAAVAAATRYALPLAFEGFMTRCFDRLDNDGYAVTNAETLRAKFSDGADAAWPGARTLIVQMASEEADNMTDVFNMLDDDALRPFVDGLVENMVAQEIRPEDCETIERGLEIFDPVPADNMAALVGFIVELVAEEEARNVEIEPEMTESRARKLREQEEERR
ncbi:hypothetical protein [uncultured Erythrobacter sp.]|uniref:hypothetical protein n=1 Tax=uncultured Erythrobacter sp. TaxID=263913 RepID=UPI002605C3C3|nr:hypothetical protein [uncultured Erythrobacter sp.]